MEGDYATELGSDGSLLFVCVETKHAGKYILCYFNKIINTVSNYVPMILLLYIVIILYQQKQG